MNMWRVFCTFEPPFEIIWSCYMSRVFSYLSKSTCLFKWWIITFFFSISLSTMGILPLHFSSSPWVGPISLVISAVSLTNASFWLLPVNILFLISVSFSSNSLAICLSFSIESFSYFFSWIRLPHSCSRFLSLSVSSS